MIVFVILCLKNFLKFYLFVYKTEITNHDVILFMLIEEPKQDNINNLEVSVLASEMNSEEVFFILLIFICRKWKTYKECLNFFFVKRLFTN